MDNPETPNCPQSPQALIAAYLDGEIAPEQLESLERWIRASDENAAQFVRLSFENQGVRTHLIAEQSAQLIFSEDGIDEDDRDGEVDAVDADIMSGVVESALAERRRHEFEAEANRKLAAQQAEDERNRRFSMRRLADSKAEKRVVVIPKTAGWLGIAAVLGLLATVITLLNPAPPTPSSTTNYRQAPGASLAPVYATLIRSLDARWDDPATAWNGSNGLRKGMHRLAEGLVEIELAGGTRVVLEGPVSFELTKTNAMELIDGRLVATVPPSGCGFTVDTPTARITDHGTEYGVHADGHTQTQILVFRGAVRAAARVEGVVVGEAVALEANEAATIDVGGASIARLAFDTTSFERRVAKRLDLVDIVAGGDGTGDARMRAIDPSTGRPTSRPILNYEASFLDSPERYIPVLSNALIDGVFIPHQADNVQVDSLGHTVSGLSVSQPQSYQLFWAGGLMPSFNEAQLRKSIEESYPDAPKSAPVLYMISNKGITLDLNAIRLTTGCDGDVRLHFEIENIDNDHADGISRSVDFLCFVDGELADSALEIRPGDARVAFDVRAHAEQRFLTLITVDSGDGLDNDWLVLHRPTLEISVDETAYVVSP